MQDVLSQTVHDLELDHLLPILRSAAQPAIRFDLTSNDEPPTVAGLSRAGGQPDLPVGAAWPTLQGRPLTFIAQVNLADIARLGAGAVLPTTGLLSFFYDLTEEPPSYDPASQGSFQVRYTPGDILLTWHTAPRSVEVLPASTMAFAPRLTVPPPSTEVSNQMLKNVKLTDEDSQTLLDFNEHLAEAYRPQGSALYHQMFGYSHNIQGDMQLEAQLVTHGINCGTPEAWNSPDAQALRAGAPDWVLLLQLDSDDGAELFWGDSGILYFWIHKDDLAQLRFGRVWGSMQSC